MLLVIEGLTNSLWKGHAFCAFVEGTQAPRQLQDSFNAVNHPKELESSMNNLHTASEPAGVPGLPGAGAHPLALVACQCAVVFLCSNKEKV